MSNTAKAARRYANYVNGQDCEGRDGATFESINPTTGAGLWPVRRIERERCGCGRARRPCRVRRALADAVSDPARAVDDALGRSDHRACRADRDHRDRTERQAVCRNAHAGPHRSGLAVLFRRTGRQDRGPGDSARSHQRPQLHGAGTARRRRGDRAVEFADIPHHHDGRPGAGGGQHHRHQAVRGDVGIGVRTGAAGRKSRHSAGRDQRRHRRTRSR